MCQDSSALAKGISLARPASPVATHLRASMAPYKIPSEIRFMSPLPAAPTGKLLKGVMKTMAQQPADANPAPAMP